MTKGPGNDDNAIVIGHTSLTLPLVSVIVINHNYGRFLAEAVESVVAQTYPRVECIVVDNASTDETGAVLDALGSRHSDLLVVRRASNAGQTPAALDGLAMSSGAYVIFLDADDVLLPTCAEAHVFTHLSLRRHVGFTSGDMLQLADGQIVVATGEDFNKYIRSGKGRRPDLVRAYRAVQGAGATGSWPNAATLARLASAIHVVPPLHTSWVWSPTSGSCYRRDALMMFADNPALANLRTGTDMYFSHAIGALSGSALIDEPVFAYRTHGGNIYTQRAQLDRTLNYRPGNPGDSNTAARLYIIDHLVAQAGRFAPNRWLKLNLVWLLLRLDVRNSDAQVGWQRRSRLAQALAIHGDAVRDTLGGTLTLLLKVCCRLPYPRV
jgi:glycosyltransferase involved in cell wall biosynthesis